MFAAAKTGYYFVLKFLYKFCRIVFFRVLKILKKSFKKGCEKQKGLYICTRLTKQ